MARGKGLLAGTGRADFIDFGLGAYSEILALQNNLREARQAERIPDSWLFGEHPFVITQGVRGDDADIPGVAMPDFSVQVVKVDRGGMTTLHCPGQLILYAIVKLNDGSMAAGRLARALLESMQGWLLKTHGVEAWIPKGRPGLYVGERKLMSVGISVRQSVSMHGIAMNLSNDLSLWNTIVACGEAGTRPISLSEILGRVQSPREQKASIRSWLKTDWGYDALREQPLAAGTSSPADERA